MAVRTAILLALSTSCAAAPPRPSTGATDFDLFWQFTRDHYCYFDDRQTDWDAVRDHYRPRAAAAQNRRELVRIFEETLDELYDPHCHLNSNLADSWRLAPYDVWASRTDGGVVVEQVRAGSAARNAGLRIGDRIVRINGVPIEDAVAARHPHFLRAADPEAERFALLSALAGRRSLPRRFEVIGVDGAHREILVDENKVDSEAPSIAGRPLEGGLFYVRISSFADEATIARFDELLEEAKASRGLIIDIRDNGGGDTTVARPIMGRFTSDRRQYASMARREGGRLSPRWPEFVDPRGPWTYARPVIVLVDRFTVSMGEGFAMGLRGMGKARVVGSKMAELGAGIAKTTLPFTKVDFQVSAEPVYDVSGVPRTAFVPDVGVDPVEGKDAILERAIQLLATQD